MSLPIGPNLLSQTLSTRASVLRGVVTETAQEIATGKKQDIGAAEPTRFGLLTARKADLSQSRAFLANAESFVRRADVKQTAMVEIEAAAQELLTLAATQLPTANGTAWSGSPPIAPGDPLEPNPVYNAESFAAVAQGVLARVTAALNASDGQGFSFAGVDGDAKPLMGLAEAGPSGQTPQGAVAAQVAANPPADAAGTAALIAALDDVFSNAAIPADPNDDFSAAFYAGAPAAGPRPAISVDEDAVLSLGLQADDAAARDLLQGLHMLASVDLTAIDPAALADYADAARTKLSEGLEGVRVSQAELGASQAKAEAAADSHRARAVLIGQEIADVEDVDPVESQARYQRLEGQLSILYELIGRTPRLNLFDYLR